MSSLQNLRSMETRTLSRPHRFLPVCLAVFAILLALSLSLQMIMNAHPGDGRRIQALADRVAAHEQSLFHGSRVLHLNNTWFIHPTVTSAASTPFAIPVAFWDPSGQRSHEQFLLPPETVMLSEEIWYEPSTGKYRRQFKTGTIPLFAIAFDGACIHTFDWTQGSAIRKQKVDPSYQASCDPAEVFGLASAFPISLAALAKNDLLSRDRGSLAEARNLLMVRTASAGPAAGPASYWRLVLNESEHSLYGIARVEGSIELFSIYRSRVEYCDGFPHQGALNDLSADLDS